MESVLRARKQSDTILSVLRDPNEGLKGDDPSETSLPGDGYQVRKPVIHKTIHPQIKCLLDDDVIVTLIECRGEVDKSETQISSAFLQVGEDKIKKADKAVGDG